MRIGLISDIHGNYEALKTTLSSLDEMEVDVVYCLGDVVGYYVQVNECCQELIDRKIPCIMGNHDWYLAGGGFCPRSNSVNDLMVYQRKIIKPTYIEWLRTFPVQRFVGNLHIVHGGWTDPIDEYILEPTLEYFSRLSGSAFASGHTHIQKLTQLGTKVHCNPGSVGQPRDNDPRAAFAVYENGMFHLHRVEYDMEPLFERMQQAGFNDYYYGQLKTGARKPCKLPTS